MLSLSEIHDRLEAELEHLENLVTEVRHAGNEAAKAEVAYKVESSKARLTVKATMIEKLTVADIDAEVTIQTEELYLNYLITANALTTCREAVRVGTTKVDALRSLAASFRNAGG
jgi:hypothetical protein